MPCSLNKRKLCNVVRRRGGTPKGKTKGKNCIVRPLLNKISLEKKSDEMKAIASDSMMVKKKKRPNMTSKKKKGGE